VACYLFFKKEHFTDFDKDVFREEIKFYKILKMSISVKKHIKDLIVTSDINDHFLIHDLRIFQREDTLSRSIGTTLQGTIFDQPWGDHPELQQYIDHENYIRLEYNLKENLRAVNDRLLELQNIVEAQDSFKYLASWEKYQMQNLKCMTLPEKNEILCDRWICDYNEFNKYSCSFEQLLIYKKEAQQNYIDLILLREASLNLIFKLDINPDLGIREVINYNELEKLYNDPCQIYTNRFYYKFE
jgi:hypothetical protein